MSSTPGNTKTQSSSLAEILSFARLHWVIVLVGILALVVVNITARPNGNLMEPLQTRNVVRILLIGTFFILLIFGRHAKYQLFRVANSVLVPITVVLLLLHFTVDALGADNLSREDRLIEDFSFLFLVTSAACLLVTTLLLLRRREVVTSIIAGLMAMLFFVIGMEEISWFQRELDVESSEFFRNLNGQGEMNFHNIYTHESEDIYYLGGFLLLGIVPFFREQIGVLLDRIGISAARVLLPPVWLIAPFMLAGAFVSQGFAARAANVTIVVGSLILLIGLMHRHMQQKEWAGFAQAVCSFVLMVVGIVLILSLDFVSQNVRPWIGKEYQEFYIAWGLAAYGASVLFQFVGSHTPNDQERSTTQARPSQAPV